MKNDFSYRSMRGGGRGSGKLWAATLLALFLVLADLVTGGKVRGAARESAAALSRAFGGAFSSVAGSGFFSTRASLEAQNRALSNEVALYQAQAAGASALQQENDQLRQLVHLAQTSAGVTAPLASSVIASPYGTFLIGAGAAEGIATNSLVLIGQDGGDGSFVVGVVSDVSAHVATVRELFAPNSAVNVIIHGNAVQLSGSGGGNARTSLPRGATVSIGDAVISPDYGGRAVGIVGSVASSSAQATQDVYVRLPINLGALQYVYIVAH